jgi:hypothetical protein
MHGGHMGKASNFLSLVKKKWREQPEVRIWKPIRIDTNPEPVPFAILINDQTINCAFLRQEKEPRHLGKRGPNSRELTVPIAWCPNLESELMPFLVQVGDSLGVLYLPCSETLKGGIRDKEENL